METSIVESIFRFIILAVILTLVIAAGWNEPLKYRFMSREEIAALHAPPQEPDTPDNSWMWDKNRRGPLDRGAYGRSSAKTTLWSGR